MSIENPSLSPPLIIKAPFANCSNGSVLLIGNKANTFLSENKNRAYTAIINNSNQSITIVLGNHNNAIVGNGIVLNASGGAFEITLNNLYYGAITAVASLDCKLSFVECSYS